MPDDTRTLTATHLLGLSGAGLLTDAVLASVVGRVAACTAHELLARAHELLLRTEREQPERQHAGVAATDVLLAEGRRRGCPELVGPLLRYATVIRLVAHAPPAQADPLLEELLRHATRYAMTLLLADAHALQARRSVQAGMEESALADAAMALALLSDPAPTRIQERTLWQRALTAALSDLGLVLTQLGTHELAAEVLRRCEERLQRIAGPAEVLINGLNRLRLQLSWGLRLERAGHRDQASERFASAHQIGRKLEPLWQNTMFTVREGPAVEECAVLAASFAFADPGTQHVPRLARLAGSTNFTADRIMVGIALGRCLEHSGSPVAAMAALSATRDALPDRSEPMLRLALAGELARVQGRLTPEEPHTRPIRDYAVTLEAEMWSLRQARIAAISSRAEHLRLAREHGMVTAQALSDPLTGLPNRRALDQQLRQALGSSAGRALAVAMIDLDGFKDVNDRYSHATGDEVLRAVASTLRTALRADDTVARYGGDEFVALLPGTAQAAARSALERSVRAVAALPAGSGAGVTLSVGVVAAGAQETADSVLARADLAMYRAKRRGGNQVCTEDDEMPNGLHSPPPAAP